MTNFDPHVKLTRDNLRELPPLCADGAWGTEMIKLGARPGEICDLWNIQAPEKVFAVASNYVAAGAQVILTNTFNSNRIALEKHGMADRAGELSRAGAAISKRAAAGKAYVFASIGPCGKMVMMGEIDAAEVTAAAAEQAVALVEGGVDAIVIETQTDLMEAEAALKGCLDAVNVPVGVSFSFDSGPNNEYTMMGVSVAQVYDMAKANGASFVGANCGVGIESFAPIVRSFSACGADLPLWVKGNAGKPTLGENGSLCYSAPPELYAGVVKELLDAGAKFIGGCCGSGPEHIRAIAEQMRRLLS
ncbi:MAG TPA: homocysteine S-methyltransferase family protein [Candidatus Hydrogenedentes bacterium]|nr:homocysteine S-methyltransferase family protein [Candidatus Hydrogenedentota bacterium]HOL75914.1 homocysteine S-methyltransferase family protein [Candidatus Hydrogenedentota bacterium]HPO85677.1 homocysteine S-methyltransferase family protein [Candidatus Hydrogenedentota bacterium]